MVHPSLFVYTTYYVVSDFILFRQPYACRMRIRPFWTAFTTPEASSQTEGDSCLGRHQYEIGIACEWPKWVNIGGWTMAAYTPG